MLGYLIKSEWSVEHLCTPPRIVTSTDPYLTTVSCIDIGASGRNHRAQPVTRHLTHLKGVRCEKEAALQKNKDQTVVGHLR